MQFFFMKSNSFSPCSCSSHDSKPFPLSNGCFKSNFSSQKEKRGDGDDWKVWSLFENYFVH